MRRAKYGNRITELDGIKFHSAREAARYAELKLLERAGKIRHLELQPAFPVLINGVKVFTYRADFAWFEDGKRRVIDIKGFDTPMSRLKRRCVEALYPNVTIEVEHSKARSAA